MIRLLTGAFLALLLVARRPLVLRTRAEKDLAGQPSHIGNGVTFSR
jgi:hypothetical protein